MLEVISGRSASAKRAAPRDQASTNVSKHARSSASTSRRSLSPSRDYPRGTDSATKPSQASPRHAEDRPVHAQDLEVFKEELSEAPGDPKLENLMMTEEEERDFYTFTLASRNARRGKTSWKASQESFILRPSRPAIRVSPWLARRVL